MRHKFSNTSDVREYINNVLMSNTLRYELPYPIKVEAFNKKTNMWTHKECIAIEKNSKASRPRLISTFNEIIELSYTTEFTLTKAFADLEVYLDNEYEKEKWDSYYSQVAPHVGRDLAKELVATGIDSKMVLCPECDILKTDVSALSYRGLEKVLEAIKKVDWLKKLMVSFKGKTYKDLSIEEKDRWHHIQWMGLKNDAETRRAHNTLSKAYNWANKCNKEVPVFDEVWYGSTKRISELLKELGIKEVIYVDYSSAALETLTTFFEEGYKMADVVLVKENNDWAKPRKGFVLRCAD